MGANCQPALRNVERLLIDYKKLIGEISFNNNFDVKYYVGDGYVKIPNFEDSCIKLKCKDGIDYTYEKTILAFDEIKDQYDFVIRTNISTFVNLKLLDNIIDSLDEDIIYAACINTITEVGSYLNDIYPRGDAYVISNNMMKSIISVSKEYMMVDNDNKEHVDDVLMGKSLIAVFGSSYYKHLKVIEYAYCPYKSIFEIEGYDFDKIVFIRFKSTPPDTYSGYSQEDNDWRLMDVPKIDECYTFIKEHTFSASANDLIIEQECYTRPMNFYVFFKGVKYGGSLYLRDMPEYLENKR